MESFRFVHAARLLLDRQLQSAGPVPERVRPIVEDATLIAWERVIECCLEEAVDLLLITGECCDPADGGLRGFAGLARGLERLAEHKIPVVVAAGPSTSAGAWLAGLDWPTNVTQLVGTDEIPILRDRKLLAIVRQGVGGPAARCSENPWLLRLPVDNEERPFNIWFTPGDSESPFWPADEMAHSFREPAGANPGVGYHAASGSAAPRTVSIDGTAIHDPGPIQALRPLETGPRGCTLVAVDASGKWKRTFVPTAPVRFEQLGLSVTAEHTRDDLLLDMIAALEQLPRHTSDRVWLIAWNIVCAGSCPPLLHDETARAQLLQTLESNHGLRDLHVHTQAVRIRTDRETPSGQALGDELSREFDSRLQDRVARSQWALARCLDDSRLHGGPWETPLRSLLADFDAGEIAVDARDLGLRWLAVGKE
ncbi:MAG TPA: hypothetical protein VL475_03415 [Planctomycetaceae bacterium]|nr:hypothetical protein [Planctomycetaceae bacterium]